MAELSVTGSSLGGPLASLLTAADIEPGQSPSYQICKTIYSYHPLGRKMAESPVTAAQSQAREVTVPDGPEDMVRDAFNDQWQADNCDRLIANTATVARIYGVGSIAILEDKKFSKNPVDYKNLWRSEIAYNVLDPLNTAGSLVLDQNPNALDFQKHAAIAVAGQPYHRSRSCTIMNEEPLYIEYTQSAFGFVGRSVYQRALYPLKSFIQTMVTDDLVSLKAGVLIAKIKQPGSIVDALMQSFTAQKRALLKEAVVTNVLSIDPDEDIQSLNFQNLEGPFTAARANILKNIATAADMPAVMLENETLTEGFGEGTEDAKIIARYVNRIREWMKPLYDYFDRITQFRAWNPEFFKQVQAKYPDEYGKMTYEQAFYRWQNSFSAVWPNLLEEPDSEKIKVEDIVFKAAIATTEVLLPQCDPDNKARLMQWLADNLNHNKLLFPNPLELDMEALATYVPPQPAEAPENKETLERADAAMARYDAALARLPLREVRKKAG